MIKFGNQAIKDIKYGSQGILRVYRGSQLIWQREGDDGDAGYRYIRVQWTSDGSGLSLYQIQAFIGQTNVALGKTVTAPQAPASGQWSGLVDGNLNTAVTASWWARFPITVDLGGVYPIDRVVITRPNQTGGNMIVDVSIDGIEWRSLGSLGGTSIEFTI